MRDRSTSASGATPAPAARARAAVVRRDEATVRSTGAAGFAAVPEGARTRGARSGELGPVPPERAARILSVRVAALRGRSIVARAVTARALASAQAAARETAAVGDLAAVRAVTEQG